MIKPFTWRTLVVLPLTLLSITAQTAPTESELTAVGERYLQHASAAFGAALDEALVMQEAIETFLDQPSEENLEAAKAAWSNARKPYAEIEAFRFGNSVIDDWEPQLNAWPLDEGFIDYVDQGSYYYELGNPVGQANIIANTRLSFGPQVLDLTNLTSDLLASLNELGGTEANVATGWHAIEFLLWGQDLNGTGPGAGNRPVTDFALDETECSNGNCDRRRQYLGAVTDLLVKDLEWGVSQWDREAKGSYRETFAQLPAREQLRRILFGVGSLSLGELAGERMKVALYANSPEDEHDCFSDTTHSTLLHDQIGISNVIAGQTDYANPMSDGTSILELLNKYDSGLAQELQSALSNTTEVIARISASAESGIAFDQLISPGNTEGAAIIQDAIDALVVQTRAIELTATVFGLSSLAANTEGHF